MSKPVDLIIANETHEAIAKIERVSELTGRSQLLDSADLPPELARAFLCAIAHGAQISVVFRALASVGAPADLDAVKARLQSARDAMREARA